MSHYCTADATCGKGKPRDVSSDVLLAYIVGLRDQQRHSGMPFSMDDLSRFEWWALGIVNAEYDRQMKKIEMAATVK